MVTPELKWPMTNWTPSPTNLLATETPCLGSETSSPCSSSTFWPRMPPPLLKSSTARLAAVGQLRAERGVRAGDRTGDAGLDLRVRRAGQTQAGGEHETRQPVFLHTTLLEVGAQTAPPKRKRSRPSSLCPGLRRVSGSVAGPLRRVVAARRRWSAGRQPAQPSRLNASVERPPSVRDGRRRVVGVAFAFEKHRRAPC